MCVTAAHMIIMTVTVQTHVLVGIRSQLGVYRRNCLRPLLLMSTLRLAAGPLCHIS